MRHANCLVALGATFLATGLALAIQTTTEFDGKTDFSKYKTWSWGSVDSSTGNAAGEKRAREAIEAQLQAKGWTKLDDGSGAAVVSAHGVVRDGETMDVAYAGWAPGWGWDVGIGTGVGTTVQTRYKSGTLIISIFDAESKKLIWRGTAEGSMDATPEANRAKVDQAVQKLFKRFPPQPAEK
jgi:hypothetical protein